MSNPNRQITNKSGLLSSSIYQYLLSVSLREPQILTRLREKTYQYPEAIMQISPEQGQFMSLLVQVLGAKNILEIGTFTGYSALWMALALPDTGKIMTCDISKDYTALAKRYWETAGVASKIELRVAPALTTLEQLLSSEQGWQFDFIFIDADKTNYEAYYEKGLQLLRQGGLMAIDNTLWEGRAADSTVQDPDTVAIRALNEKIYQDSRVQLSLLPMADGITLVRKP